MDAYEKWFYVANLEEHSLKQRAKLHWLDKGDLNNKNFHNAIRSRQAQNAIREVRFIDGRIVTNQSDVKEEAVQFFSELLNLKPDCYVGTTTE